MNRDDSGLWAVVPVKDFQSAKQRLAAVLNPEERERLFRAMLEDVLIALTATAGLAGVVVVTRDPRAGGLAEELGIRMLTEADNRGQTAAVTAAARMLAAEGARGMMAIPGDVPLITPAEVEQLISAHAVAPAVTIAPARDELGSNAVACSPPDVIPLRFGDNSFIPHLETARRLGIEPGVVKLPGLGLDIDRPEDLMTFLRSPSPTRAFAYLEQSGLTEHIRRLL